MKLESFRDRIWMNYFIVFIRFLIGFAFIPSGLVKVFGHRFTSLPDSNPVGHFFETLYHVELYWVFLGAAQVLAAFLLMSQRFATVGALLFLAIISNILVITLSMDFSYTHVITSFMFLATIVLIVWDYQKIAVLFFSSSVKYKVAVRPDLISKLWEKYGICLGVFLIGVCCMPYTLNKELVNSVTYFFMPLFITLISFSYVLYKDLKNFKVLNQRTQ